MGWSTHRPGMNPIYRTKAHREARAALLRAYQPGDPCCLCGHPMWPRPDGRTDNLHADHEPGTTSYRGLAHGSPCQECGKNCNQVDGAKRGRARQEQSTKPKSFTTTRRWGDAPPAP